MHIRDRCGPFCSCGNQRVMIGLAEPEKQLRLMIKLDANRLERRCDVLAHIRPIGARAGEMNFVGFRDQPGFKIGEDVHDIVAEFSA